MTAQDHTSSPNVTPADDPSPIQSILLHAHRLVRKEIDLLKAEVSERVSKAGSAVVMIAIGAILLLPALNVLAAAAVTALVALELAGWVASLIVAAVLIVIALILVMSGISTLKKTSFVPRDTIDTLERDARVLKETIKNDA
ncbi:phage holin family protein [Jannaschia formosa]|uniref:phage holin family protein n=1 Tax=Jannaschia formosa TaxID=2259592 RepID=UPI000E1B7619|nr:phage holin family protein [Jannaschia formosa]TFL19239.1 phage holin family protein [Jannaschia formosa]